MLNNTSNWNIVCRHSPSPGQEAQVTSTIDTGQRIDWQRDVDAALTESRVDHKPLLLDFTAAPQ